jgi:hypothetical protein
MPQTYQWVHKTRKSTKQLQQPYQRPLQTEGPTVGSQPPIYRAAKAPGDPNGDPPNDDNGDDFCPRNDQRGVPFDWERHGNFNGSFGGSGDPNNGGNNQGGGFGGGPGGGNPSGSGPGGRRPEGGGPGNPGGGRPGGNGEPGDLRGPGSNDSRGLGFGNGGPPGPLNLLDLLDLLKQ